MKEPRESDWSHNLSFWHSSFELLYSLSVKHSEGQLSLSFRHISLIDWPTLQWAIDRLDLRLRRKCDLNRVGNC